MNLYIVVSDSVRPEGTRYLLVKTDSSIVVAVFQSQTLANSTAAALNGS